MTQPHLSGGRVRLAAVVVLCICAAAQAQRRGFGSSRLGGLHELLRRPDVQKELGLTSTQIKKIQASGEEAGEDFREQIGGLRGDLSPQERRDAFARLRENIEKRRQASRKNVEGILNQTQRSRLAELEFRFNLQRSANAALASAGIELDVPEAKKLQTAQREIQDEVRRKIAQIQQEANLETLCSVLGSAKLERLLGDDFSFETGTNSVGGDRVEVPRDRRDDPRQDSDDPARSRRERTRRPPR